MEQPCVFLEAAPELLNIIHMSFMFQRIKIWKKQ
jgi:hypothetical protein